MKSKMICINNIETDFKNKSIPNHYYNLTINKSYDIINFGIGIVEIVDDKGNYSYFPSHLFRDLTIEDYREIKLKEIGI